MKKALLTAALIALAPAYSAQAATFVTATPSSNPYSGPTPTYDFSTPAPITGGAYRTGTTQGISTSPVGTDDPYYAVGPSVLLGTPAVLTLSQFAAIGSLSFVWGSIDTGNTLQVLSRASTVLATITGTQIQGLVGTAGVFYPRGALVTLNFTDGTQFDIGGLRFSSRNNAFEIDNVAIAPVPEPATWAMLLFGFAFAGFALRRSKRTTMRVRYA